MHLKKLHLYQFKNHENREFNFCSRLNCITGDNGVGKTNVLDAIHYLTHTKSYFSRQDSNIFMHSKEQFAVRGQLESNGNDVDVSCGLILGGKKVVKKDGKKYKKISDFIGKINTVFITPTDILLIYESADVRRRFLNMFIAQFNSSYLRSTINYNSLLDHRNKALKMMLESGRRDATLIHTYNKKLNEYGKEIYRIRREFIQEFVVEFKELFKSISSGIEEVDVHYQSDLTEEVAENFLDTTMEMDFAAGRTTRGVHRDDLKFIMNGEPLKSFGSQGQIKSFLIALKMAQFQFLKKKTGDVPILLLDDIFEKIDDTRIKNLLALVEAKGFEQVFITDAHPERCEHYLRDLEVEKQIILLE
jgi:DNA replication and repair protein RecF